MSGDLALRWARRLVSSFADAGVHEAVVSPGSRSAPIALAIAAEPRLRAHVVVDERAAAFFALGVGRATGAPALVVCTSGSAAGHFLPAILEASAGHVPLVAVTADRPPELRDCGAPQTLDQLRLFGAHVRHFVDLGPPDPAPGAFDAVARAAAQSVLAARWPVPGAVHVNAPLRKPLEPSDDAWRTAPLGAPAPRALPPRAVPSSEAVELVAGALEASERGVLAVGALPAGFPAAALAALADRAGLPVFADTTSQLRGPVAPRGLVAGFEAILAAPGFAAAHEPDLVLELGRPLLSPSYAAWIAAHPRARRLVVAAHGWSDPLGGAAALVLADPAELVAAVTARLGPGAPRGAASWRAAFERAERVAREETARALGEREASLVEGEVTRTLLDRLPEGALLQLAASKALREPDRFSEGPRARVSVLSPRGANGIDGAVASAAGAHAASGRPTALACGDVALLHDVGSLVLLRDVPGPFVVVAIHDGGGHIFDELPVARSAAVPAATLARFFTTPHGLGFADAARFAGIAHERPATRAALAAALDRAFARPGATLVEVAVDPGASAACRLLVRERVARRLDEHGEARP